MRLKIALLLWLVAALLIGASGLLARSPLPPPPIALGLTVLALLTVWSSTTITQSVREAGARALVAFHIVRVAAGIYFLVLAQRGVLPREFGWVAGYGDIAVGLTAILVCWWCFPLRTPAQHRTLLLWNAFGLLDILGVLANGLRLFLRDPAIGEPFTRLPLALLPMFVVPLVITSHVLIFVWRREFFSAERFGGTRVSCRP